MLANLTPYCEPWAFIHNDRYKRKKCFDWHVLHNLKMSFSNKPTHEKLHNITTKKLIRCKDALVKKLTETKLEGSYKYKEVYKKVYSLDRTQYLKNIEKYFFKGSLLLSTYLLSLNKRFCSFIDNWRKYKK